ncbi:MAG TPA: CopG family antitoxin [Thermoanaerobaculia bacterium]|jgi:hypothetical protein|nr:CopG family antitoxin [Thermoanaerobaculia bacterium]
MSANRSSVSNAESYKEIGEFWDRNDAGDFWDQSSEADFEVDLKGNKWFFALEQSLADRLHKEAIARGTSPETLANLWIQEKLTGA